MPPYTLLAQRLCRVEKELKEMKKIMKDWLPRRIMEDTAKLMEDNGVRAGNITRGELERIVRRCIEEARNLTPQDDNNSSAAVASTCNSITR